MFETKVEGEKKQKYEILRHLLDEAPDHMVKISDAVSALGTTEQGLASLMTNMRFHNDPEKRFSAVRKGEYICYGESKIPRRMGGEGHLDLRFAALRGMCSRQPELLPEIIAKIDQMILESLV